MQPGCMARTEAGEREVGLNETLQLAAALGVHPAQLFVPFLEDGVAIAPNFVITAGHASRWFKGQQPLMGEDERLYRTLPSDEEWIVLQNNTIRFMAERMQEMVDAMAADDKDEMARLADVVGKELAQRVEKGGRPGRP